MKITLEQTNNKKHSATIETESDDLDIWEVWEELIRPLLLAFEYQPDSVDGLVNKEK